MSHQQNAVLSFPAFHFRFERCPPSGLFTYQLNKQKLDYLTALVPFFYTAVSQRKLHFTAHSDSRQKRRLPV